MIVVPSVAIKEGIYKRIQESLRQALRDDTLGLPAAFTAHRAAVAEVQHAAMLPASGRVLLQQKRGAADEVAMPFAVEEEPHHEVRELAAGGFGEGGLILYGDGDGAATGETG